MKAKPKATIEQLRAELVIVNIALQLACKNRTGPWGPTDDMTARYYLQKAYEVAKAAKAKGAKL